MSINTFLRFRGFFLIIWLFTFVLSKTVYSLYFYITRSRLKLPKADRHNLWLNHYFHFSYFKTDNFFFFCYDNVHCLLVKYLTILFCFNWRSAACLSSIEMYDGFPSREVKPMKRYCSPSARLARDPSGR